MQTYADKLQQRATDARDALASLEKHFFTKNKPQRFVSGVALAHEEINGIKMCVEGMKFEVPTVLLFNHDWLRPFGRVANIEVRDAQVFFKAEIANNSAWCDDLWRHIKLEKLACVSIDGLRLHEPISGNEYVKWKLVEISVMQAGADPGAVLTKCWEQDPVVYLDRTSKVVHWSRP